MEMSFADEEDVMRETERLLRKLWHRVLDLKTPENFPRMTYHDAMALYGSDKPDLRYESKVRHEYPQCSLALTILDTQHHTAPNF